MLSYLVARAYYSAVSAYRKQLAKSTSWRPILIPRQSPTSTSSTLKRPPVLVPAPTTAQIALGVLGSDEHIKFLRKKHSVSMSFTQTDGSTTSGRPAPCDLSLLDSSFSLDLRDGMRSTGGSSCAPQ